MNILLIGNGFDLAHGLPTRYTDFLEFVKVIRQVVNVNSPEDLDKIIWGKIHIKIREIIEIKMENTGNGLFSQKAVWEDLIVKNYWIEYFLQCDMYQKENWIDLEREISRVIKSFDKSMRTSSLTHVKQNFVNVIDNLQTISTYKQLRDKLLNDLNKFIRAFEIYLSEYVERMNIKVISLDIKEIVAKSYEDNGRKGTVFAKILSFNYTNTCEKMYLNEYTANWSDFIDYIHGKADINNSIETNNMVLGIDEYLEDDRKNKDVAFIAFKKFYQRIYKETGCKYKEWVNKIQGDYFEYVQKQMEADRRERKYIPDNMQAIMNRLATQAIKSQKCRKHNLYIFGHSLDVTDKDILRDLILNNNVYTTIFYVNKDVMGQQIANLVKVIGQDELIKRTGGSTKTIEFKQQQDMVLIKKSKFPM